MQKDVDQLLTDIRQAQQKAPEKPVFSDNYEEYQAQMLALESAPETTYEKLMGLSYEQFPSSDTLNEVQMTELIDSITETFQAFDMWIDLPAGVPVAEKYKLIRNLFIEKVNYMPGFSKHFDFCSTNCEGCKIENYCPSNLANSGPS